MNTLKQCIPFTKPAIFDFEHYEIDKELITGREQKIKGLVAAAFLCLSAPIYSTTKRLVITPIAGLGILFLVFSISLAAIKIISSKFAEWDEKRAINALREKALKALNSNKACDWLIKNEQPAILGNHKPWINGDSPLFRAALEQKNTAWLHWLYEKASDGARSGFITNHSDELNSIDPDFFSADKISAVKERMRKAAEEECIKFLRGGRDRFGFLRIDQSFCDKISNETIIAEYMQSESPHPRLLECLIKKDEALRLLLGKQDFQLKYTSETPLRNLFDVAIDLDNSNACDLFFKYFYRKNLRPYNEYKKYAFLRSFKNVDNPKLPDHLIKNRMVTPGMFNSEEQFFIIFQALIPFNTENVRINRNTWTVEYREGKQKQAADFRSKNRHHFEFSAAYPLKENYERHQDKWFEQLVLWGINPQAKNRNGMTAQQAIQNLFLSDAIKVHLNAKNFLFQGEYFKKYEATLEDRCTWSDKLKIKIENENRSLIHEILGQYLVQDVHKQINVSYAISSDRSALIEEKERKVAIEKPVIVHNALNKSQDEVELVNDVSKQIMELYAILIPKQWESEPALQLDLTS